MCVCSRTKKTQTPFHWLCNQGSRCRQQWFVGWCERPEPRRMLYAHALARMGAIKSGTELKWQEIPTHIWIVHFTWPQRNWLWRHSSGGWFFWHSCRSVAWLRMSFSVVWIYWIKQEQRKWKYKKGVGVVRDRSKSQSWTLRRWKPLAH